MVASHKNNIQNFYMMKMDAQRIIDAGPKGNLSRFMNHSCAPNLNTVKWMVNGDARVGLFAVRDIEPYEELTFDYNFRSLGEMRMCFCGAETCAGFLGARPEHNVATTPSVGDSSATSASQSRSKRSKKRARTAAEESIESAAEETRATASKKTKKRKTSVSGSSSLDSSAPSTTAGLAVAQPSKKCYRWVVVQQPT